MKKIILLLLFFNIFTFVSCDLNRSIDDISVGGNRMITLTSSSQSQEIEYRNEINAGYYHNKIVQKIMPLYQNVQYDFDQIYSSVRSEGLKEGMFFTTSNNIIILDDFIQSTTSNNVSSNQINFLQVLNSTLNEMQNNNLINSNLKNHFKTFILNIYNSNYPDYNENLVIAYQLCQNDIEESIVKNVFLIANYSHDLWTVPGNDPRDAHGIIVNDMVGGFIGALWWGAKKAYNGDYDVSDDDLKELAVDIIGGAVMSSLGTGLIKFAKYMSA